MNRMALARLSPVVRSAYKQVENECYRMSKTQLCDKIMWSARDAPVDKATIRKMVKREFAPYLSTSDSKKLAELTAKADYFTNELDALAMLHKYRQLKRNYDPSFSIAFPSSS
jgi:hypothetical protein